MICLSKIKLPNPKQNKKTLFEQGNIVAPFKSEMIVINLVDHYLDLYFHFSGTTTKGKRKKIVQNHRASQTSSATELELFLVITLQLHHLVLLLKKENF